MNLNKTIKLVSTIMVVLTILCVATTAFGIITPASIKATDVSGASQIASFGGKLIGIIQTVGVVISVVILLVLGIKYMMGSAEEKAEYKKSMIPYLVGAILIFAASTIANIVYQFANGANT